MNNSALKQQLNFESPSNGSLIRELSFGSSPRRSPSKKSPSNGSPSRSSPVKKFSFGSPSNGSPPRRSHIREFSFGSPPRRSPARKISSGSHFKKSPIREKQFVPRHFVCSPNVIVKSANTRDPLKVFCHSLTNDGVFTQSPQPHHESSSPIIGAGSFFETREGTTHGTVEKQAFVGSNSRTNLSPSDKRIKMSKKDVLNLLDALQKSHGNPQVVKLFEIYFSQTGEHDGTLTLIQEKCTPLQKNVSGLISFVKCIIALYKAGLTISDVKPDNFMIDACGNVVCIDLDLRKAKDGSGGGLYKLVASGEYSHTTICASYEVESPQFQQLLLVFIETLSVPIVGNRKDTFREVNQTKGLLQSILLLSSNKSVSETNIDDFREVLRNIELANDDINYLVDLIQKS